MLIHEYVDREIDERKEWALRRKEGKSNNKQLLIITCLDERIPVYEALGIDYTDAYVFRNAGGVITDDVIRSAMISTLFFDTQEIIVLSHTGCEMTTFDPHEIISHLEDHHIDIEDIVLNPALPELTLENQKHNFQQWLGTFCDVDEHCATQVRLLQECPLIPDNIVIHGYIWQVESMSLRRPHEKIYELIDETDLS